MTNEEAKQQAEKIVNGVWHRRRANDDIASRYLTAMLIEDIAQALAVPAGCVRDENGVDRKVLGTLPLTKDGCVVGVDAVVFHPDSICVSGEAVYEGNRVDVPTKRGSDNFICRSFDTTVEDCYSTREAASSALSSTEKGKANETA